MILQYLGIEYNGEYTRKAFVNFKSGINDLNVGIPPQSNDVNYTDGYQAALDLKIFIRKTENGKTLVSVEERPQHFYPNALMAIRAGIYPNAELDAQETFIYRLSQPWVMCSADLGSTWWLSPKMALDKKYRPRDPNQVYMPPSWREQKEMDDAARKAGRHALQQSRKPKTKKHKRTAIL